MLSVARDAARDAQRDREQDAATKALRERERDSDRWIRENARAEVRAEEERRERERQRVRERNARQEAEGLKRDSAEVQAELRELDAASDLAGNDKLRAQLGVMIQSAMRNLKERVTNPPANDGSRFHMVTMCGKDAEKSAVPQGWEVIDNSSLAYAQAHGDLVNMEKDSQVIIECVDNRKKPVDPNYIRAIVPEAVAARVRESLKHRVKESDDMTLTRSLMRLAKQDDGKLKLGFPFDLDEQDLKAMRLAIRYQEEGSSKADAALRSLLMDGEKQPILDFMKALERSDAIADTHHASDPEAAANVQAVTSTIMHDPDKGLELAAALKVASQHGKMTDKQRQMMVSRTKEKVKEEMKARKEEYDAGQERYRLQVDRAKDTEQSLAEARHERMRLEANLHDLIPKVGGEDDVTDDVEKSQIESMKSEMDKQNTKITKIENLLQGQRDLLHREQDENVELGKGVHADEATKAIGGSAATEMGHAIARFQGDAQTKQTAKTAVEAVNDPASAYLFGNEDHRVGAVKGLTEKLFGADPVSQPHDALGIMTNISNGTPDALNNAIGKDMVDTFERVTAPPADIVDVVAGLADHLSDAHVETQASEPRVSHLYGGEDEPVGVQNIQFWNSELPGDLSTIFEALRPMLRGTNILENDTENDEDRLVNDHLGRALVGSSGHISAQSAYLATHVGKMRGFKSAFSTIVQNVRNNVHKLYMMYGKEEFDFNAVDHQKVTKRRINDILGITSNMKDTEFQRMNDLRKMWTDVVFTATFIVRSMVGEDVPANNLNVTKHVMKMAMIAVWPLIGGFTKDIELPTNKESLPDFIATLKSKLTGLVSADSGLQREGTAAFQAVETAKVDAEKLFENEELDTAGAMDAWWLFTVSMVFAQTMGGDALDPRNELKLACVGFDPMYFDLMRVAVAEFYKRTINMREVCTVEYGGDGEGKFDFESDVEVVLVVSVDEVLDVCKGVTGGYQADGQHFVLFRKMVDDTEQRFMRLNMLVIFAEARLINLVRFVRHVGSNANIITTIQVASDAIIGLQAKLASEVDEAERKELVMQQEMIQRMAAGPILNLIAVELEKMTEVSDVLFGKDVQLSPFWDANDAKDLGADTREDARENFVTSIIPSICMLYQTRSGDDDAIFSSPVPLYGTYSTTVDLGYVFMTDAQTGDKKPRTVSMYIDKELASKSPLVSSSIEHFENIKEGHHVETNDFVLMFDIFFRTAVSFIANADKFKIDSELDIKEIGRNTLSDLWKVAERTMSEKGREQELMDMLGYKGVTIDDVRNFNADPSAKNQKLAAKIVNEIGDIHEDEKEDTDKKVDNMVWETSSAFGYAAWRLGISSGDTSRIDATRQNAWLSMLAGLKAFQLARSNEDMKNRLLASWLSYTSYSVEDGGLPVRFAVTRMLHNAFVSDPNIKETVKHVGGNFQFYIIQSLMVLHLMDVIENKSGSVAGGGGGGGGSGDIRLYILRGGVGGRQRKRKQKRRRAAAAAAAQRSASDEKGSEDKGSDSDEKGSEDVDKGCDRLVLHPDGMWVCGKLDDKSWLTERVEDKIRDNDTAKQFRNAIMNDAVELASTFMSSVFFTDLGRRYHKMKERAATQSDKHYPTIPSLEAEVRDAFTRERSKWNALVKYQQTVGEGPTGAQMMESVDNSSLGSAIILATQKRVDAVRAPIQDELDMWQQEYAETFLLKERGASAARLLTVMYHKAHQNANLDRMPNVLRAAGISLASFLGANPSTVLEWMRWGEFTSQVDSASFIIGANVTTSGVPEWKLESDVLPYPLDSMTPLGVDVAGEIKILQSDPKHMFPAMMAGALDAYEGNEVSGHKQFTGALWASLLVSNSKPMWTSFGSMCVNKIIGLSDALSGIISTSVQAGGGLTDHATALKDSILSRAEVLMKNIDTGDAMTATACLNLPLIMFVNDVDWMRTKFKCEMDPSSGKVSAATSVDVASACHRMWGTKNIFVSGATARRAQTCNPDDLKKLFQNVEEHEGERERERERSGDAKLFLRAGGSISASEAAAQLLESMRGGSGGTAGDADDDDDSEENEENEVLSGVNGGSSSCGTADDAVQNTAVLT